MAATATHLTDGTSTANPAGTAVVSPAANRLMLAAVVVANSNVGLPGAGAVALTGLGLTWTLVASQDYAQRRRLYLFAAQGSASPGQVTITYTPGANSFQEMQWAISELAGVDPTTALGAPAVASTGFDTTLTISIGGTPAAGDAPYAAFGKEGAGDIPALEASYAQLSSRESANVRHLVAGWDAGQDVTATLTWGSGSGAGGVGVLVVAGEASDETTAAPFGLTVTFGAPAARVDHVTTAEPLDLTLAFGAPITTAAFSTAAEPFTLSLAFVQDGGESALPLPAIGTVLPDLTVTTEMDLATSTDVSDLAVLTDLPTLAVLATVEG